MIRKYFVRILCVRGYPKVITVYLSRSGKNYSAADDCSARTGSDFAWERVTGEPLVLFCRDLGFLEPSFVRSTVVVNLLPDRCAVARSVPACGWMNDSGDGVKKLYGVALAPLKAGKNAVLDIEWLR